MRNDNDRWPPAQGLDRPGLNIGSLQMWVQRPARQTLISGPVDAALAAVDLPKAAAWPDAARGETYAIRLRRDRILVVNGPDLSEGWHDARGIAVNDMTDGLAMIEIAGPDAMPVLTRGTEISKAERSGSVMRRFAGYEVMIYAHDGAPDALRLHVSRGHLDGLWALLTDFAQAAAR